MPIPMLIDTTYSTTAAARPFQLKKNNAVIARIWKSTMKLVVTQETDPP